ncbi:MULTISPECIES: hypothetical protein [unclassified Bradyrhizobium]|nr:hypothetical protein [Bradyrhizobium sp. USDA 4541]MCP1852101.1 hypothetical protein [Bradyrhizobium sp. USDA 4541]
MTTKEEFTTHAIMAMAQDVVDAQKTLERLRLAFEALAKEHGVKLPEPQ